MRTNIELDDELIQKAFKLSRAKTKRELIREALQEMILHRGKLDLRDLKGKIGICPDYDHKQARKDGADDTR